MFSTYGFWGIVKLCIYKIRTKFVFSNARIIRFPFRVRGKKFISIEKGFTTGYNCRLDAFSFNLKNTILISIGENVQLNDSVHIGAIKKVIIKENVLIASHVFITDHNHGNYRGVYCDSPLSIPSDRELVSSPVIIEKNVWIGEYVSILPGVTIGEGSIIGTMSVVSKDIPPYSIAVGSPARVIKNFDFQKNEWVRV